MTESQQFRYFIQVSECPLLEQTSRYGISRSVDRVPRWSSLAGRQAVVPKSIASTLAAASSCSGSPGTYLAVDSHGKLGFGFDTDLWFEWHAIMDNLQTTVTVPQ